MSVSNNGFNSVLRRTRVQLFGLVVLIALLLTGCGAGESNPLSALQQLSPGNSCEGLATEMLAFSDAEEKPEIGSLLDIYNIEQTSHSNVRLICTGIAETSLTTTNTTGEKLINIEFYKFTGEDGEPILGYNQIDNSVASNTDEVQLGNLAAKISPTETPTPIPTPAPVAVSTLHPVASTATPAPTASPTPLATVAPTAAPIPTIEPTATPSPVPTATSIPTATPLPTATPVFYAPTAPLISTETSTTLPTDFFWIGESENIEPLALGQVGTDFTIAATVVSPHDIDRGIWSWGLALTHNGITQNIYLLSTSQIIVSGESTSSVVITKHAFNLSTTQNTENDVRVRVWNGVVTIYVNGLIAASIEGVWDEPGDLALITDMPGSSLAQGFLLRTVGLTLGTANLTRNEFFEAAVVSEHETTLITRTGKFDQVSATLENPFHVSQEALDFGLRIGLPEFSRELEIKHVSSSNGLSIFNVRLTHKPTGALTKQKVIRIDNHTGHLFKIDLREFAGVPELVIDGISYTLGNFEINFDSEYFEDVELFVNSENRVIDSNDARFLRSPAVRVSNFGLWND
jgi:hypothetical protein